MVEEIAIENGRLSNYEWLPTLTLDWVILHTVVQHSSTSTYMPNFNEIVETFCGQTDVRTHVHTHAHMPRQTNGHLRPPLLGRLCRRVDLKMTMELHHSKEYILQS